MALNGQIKPSHCWVKSGSLRVSMNELRLVVKPTLPKLQVPRPKAWPDN